MDWFGQVYRWRTGASTVWSLMLNIPALFLFTVLISLMNGGVSLWNVGFGGVYLLCLVVIQIIYSVTSTAKLVVHKTRLEKIFNVLSPSRICIQFLFVAMATVCGMCLSNLEGHNIWTYPNSSSVSQPEVNKIFVLTTLHSGYLGLFFCFRYFTKKEFVLVFPVIQQKKVFRLKGHIYSSIKSSFMNFINRLCLFVVLYCLFGHYFKRVVEVIFRLKKSDFSYWSLFCDIVNPWSLWQLMLSGMFVHMSWSWGLRLFRVFHTQLVQLPVLPLFSNQSNNTLLSAMRSNVPLLKHLAFLDLCQLAETSAPRRKQVFSLNPSGNPAVWTDIQKECLSLLNKIIADLGGSQASSEGDNGSLGSLPPPTTTDKEFKSVKGWPHVGEDILTRRQVVSERARLWSHESVIEARPEIPRQEKPSSDEKNLYKMLNTAKRKFIANLKKKPLFAFFLSDLPDSTDNRIFSESQLIVWAVTALSQLAMASYTEDTYGVVQQDLSTVVARLIELVQLLEKKVGYPLTKTKPANKLLAVEINGRYAVKSAVMTGLQLIFHTFKDIRFLHLSQEQINICRKLRILH